MIDNKDRYVIDNFNRKTTFASFLPGISGEQGIPIWCHYVNRGQCISSFGVEDKNHSIMQFFPAHYAFQNIKTMGFRTFIKVNSTILEAFTNEDSKQIMKIGINELEIEEINEEMGLKINIQYFILPYEKMGALVRIVCIENLDDNVKELEVIDGMPAIIPYGVSLTSLNEMGQTAKAWMEVQDHEKNLPFFHLRASMEDSAQVKEIVGGNFGFAFDEKCEELPVFINNENVFSFDTSLTFPYEFKNASILQMLEKPQITQNDIPCCFFAKKVTLSKKAKLTMNEIFGQTKSKSELMELQQKAKNSKYFLKKLRQAISIADILTKNIMTKTGNKIFDLYCRQTYLDNLLRGGFPMILGGNKVFYIYSRKHGDIERDYNFFKMLPEFYSQGNGNFRDVNQNRRCDVMFSPFVKDYNIKLFYNSIQLNGYNPLGIEKITYYLKDQNLEYCSELLGEENKGDFSIFLSKSFTPGALYFHLNKCLQGSEEEREKTFQLIMNYSISESKTDFIEGYWTDHWTYNLDLIESYLILYPDMEEELLWNDYSYTHLGNNADILPRSKRYHKTENGVRQYKFLVKKQDVSANVTDEIGNIIHSNLLEKLILLNITKFSALDSYGLGIEMEGGKPGWYDALNGLPGLLGSSMSETYELMRNIEFTLDILNKYPNEVTLIKELSDFASCISNCIKEYKSDFQTKECFIDYWNKVNDCKEDYWKKVSDKVSGEMVTSTNVQMTSMLLEFQEVLRTGITRALKIGNGICPTYFYYTVTQFSEDNNGIHIIDMNMNSVPYFLEGPVRFMKLKRSLEDKKELYKKIHSSDLFDKKLKMYKVNSSIQGCSYELGRARAFTPGWLENESIWIHMEYKYLLELLKNGLYEEFLADFHNVTIPFLKEETYGRSLLENSSFIASSVNPNPNIHGKGFVARLSGSTVEFINIWQIMMFGKTPFTFMDSLLQLTFYPTIPSYLIDDSRKINGMFLGKTIVEYELWDREDFIPGNYTIASYCLHRKSNIVKIDKPFLSGDLVTEIRDGHIDKIVVCLVR